MRVAFPWPNLLTALRLAAVPLIVLPFYLPEGWLTLSVANRLAAFLFIAASLTDWLDGFLARRLGLQSPLGAFLDPVADKLMVAAVLIVLVDLERAHALAAAVIIGREIAVSALREWMALLGASRKVAVALVGKLKTGVQMVALALLLYGEPLAGFDLLFWGNWLLAAAVALTLFSFAYYLIAAWPELHARRF